MNDSRSGEQKDVTFEDLTEFAAGAQSAVYFILIQVKAGSEAQVAEAVVVTSGARWSAEILGSDYQVIAAVIKPDANLQSATMYLNAVQSAISDIRDGNGVALVTNQKTMQVIGGEYFSAKTYTNADGVEGAIWRAHNGWP